MPFLETNGKGGKLERVKCSLVRVKCEILGTRARVTNDSWLREPEALGKVLACRFRFVNYLCVTATGSTGTDIHRGNK